MRVLIVLAATIAAASGYGLAPAFSTNHKIDLFDARTARGRVQLERKAAAGRRAQAVERVVGQQAHAAREEADTLPDLPCALAHCGLRPYQRPPGPCKDPCIPARSPACFWRLQK